MSFTDGLVALAVVGGIGWIIITKMAKDNPKIQEFFQSLSPLVEKIEPVKVDKQQQIWQQRRERL